MMSERQKRPKAIWSVGGGKGGTGKTLISSNMALYLARLGQRVLLVDADLGGANVHTCLGVEAPRYGLGEFLRGDQRTLDGFVERTSVTNLYFLSGVARSTGSMPRRQDRGRLARAVRKMDVDYVVLDLGSGASRQVMDLFLIGETAICVMIPEPTSIENTYRFLKEFLYRSLAGIKCSGPARQMLRDMLAEDRSDGYPSMARLMERIQREQRPAAKALKTRVERLDLRLILNQVRSPDDAEIGFAVRSAIRKYFGLRADFVGYVQFDDDVIESIRSRQPLLVNFPESKAAKCIENITHKLLTQGQLSFDF